MSTTHAPLPGWDKLASILYSGSIGKKDITLPWHSEDEISGCLSRSAWSLAIIAMWRKKYNEVDSIRVWVPDFFCDASLAPLRQLGVDLVFYPILDDLSPDNEACELQAISKPPDIFILVHYFGKPNQTSFAYEFCSKNGAWLVEDAAHVLQPVNNIGKSGDFVLFSPHKHLAIPDGAVLVLRNSGPAKLKLTDFKLFGDPKSWPGQLSALVQDMGLYVKKNQMASIIWLIKRLMQKIGVRPRIVKSNPFAEPKVSKNEPTINMLEPPAQSFIGKCLLSVSADELDEIALIRKRNCLLWNNIIGNPDFQALPSTGILAFEEWTPYMLVYKTDTAIAECLYNKWFSKGLPVLTWPDLAPEVVADFGRHNMAWALRHNRLYLPVHQTLSFSGFGNQKADIE